MPNTRPRRSASEEAQHIGKGKRQYMIASRRGKQAALSGLRPMSAGALRGVLGNMPGVDIVRVISPRRSVSTLSAPVMASEAAEVYVAQIDEDQVEALLQTAPPNLIIEEDAVLDYGHTMAPEALTSALSPPGAMQATPIRFKVVGSEGQPLTHVSVQLVGEGFPTQGTTDEGGEATLLLHSRVALRARAVIVSASPNHWGRYITEPTLNPDQINVIVLRPLDQTIPGFPAFRYGWGQRLMGLDRVNENTGGQGVKVAVVDSGADSSHPLLHHLTRGANFTDVPTPWSEDSIGHGSHCAGIISAHDENGKSMRGFVPEAEIHILKVFPGGRFSSLLDALDYCIDEDIDVVNLSLGSAQGSATVEQKLEEVVASGIACIVAAGNSGGAVQYPASSPQVMAVSAIGMLNEFPSDTWHAQTVQRRWLSPEGVFFPTFSCFGPEVNVGAPGVAIVSTVPGGKFEAKSGTSMAAPHVTGMAALLLAHDPFMKQFPDRSEARVAALFQRIQSICSPLFPPERTGAGIPNLGLVAPSLAVAKPAEAQANGGQDRGRLGPQAWTPPYPQVLPLSGPVPPVYVPTPPVAILGMTPLGFPVPWVQQSMYR